MTTVNKMTKIYLGFIMVVSLFLVACNNDHNTSVNQDPIRVQEQFFAIDTLITITIVNHPEATTLIKNLRTMVNDYEKMMSISIEGSDVYRINQKHSGEFVVISPETFHVIETSLKFGEKTQGAFDITIYPLIRLWDLKAEKTVLPTDEEIGVTKSLVNYQKVLLDRDRVAISLQNENMAIDLGGVAKGFIGDQMARYLREQGVEHGIINLGGDVLVIGERWDNTPWTVGVAHPRREDSGKSLLARIKARDEVVITSGDYERFNQALFEEKGMRYHHIIDPSTGYPSQRGIMTTAVIGQEAMIGDIIATALFNMTVEAGMELLNSLEGYEGMIVTEDKQIYATKGMQDKLELEDMSYELILGKGD